jgi:hypothetical protein
MVFDRLPAGVSARRVSSLPRRCRLDGARGVEREIALVESGRGEMVVGCSVEFVGKPTQHEACAHLRRSNSQARHRHWCKGKW